MLSDAAYGLIMVIGCGLALLKFKNMEPSMNKSLRMFFFCGISTTFWGFLFGSFFGDAVAVISRTFFEHEVVLGPLWFEPIKEPMRMLIFALLVGVIHPVSYTHLDVYKRQKPYYVGREPYAFSSSNFFMNSTSFSTPSIGIAL